MDNDDDDDDYDEVMTLMIFVDSPWTALTCVEPATRKEFHKTVLRAGNRGDHHHHPDHDHRHHHLHYHHDHCDHHHHLHLTGSEWMPRCVDS